MLPTPIASDYQWHRIIDTAQSTPEDFHSSDHASLITQIEYPMMARSSIVLMAHPV